MKNFGRNSILSFGSIILAAAWLFTSAAQAATPGAAQVKKIVGTASYTDAKGGGPLKEGDILFQGATIITGAGSYVDLFLGVNGDSLRVEADSTLALNKLDYTRAGEVIVNTQLEVKKGSTVANVVNKLSKASKYEIKTPAGVAGIRGTVLRAGTTRIVCLIGRISFVPIAGGGVQLVISGGAGYQAGAAGAVRATSVETTGLARTACSLTANTMANMVAQAVQQFTAAIAAEAATEAAKTGGNPSTEAALVAKAVLAQLIAEVQQAVAQAPQGVRTAVQQAVTSLQNNSDAVGATAAASAAAAAVVNNGGNAQQAKAAASAAATEATRPPPSADGTPPSAAILARAASLANAAANNVTTGAINGAIQARTQGGTTSPTESLVTNTRPADGVATGGTTSTLPGTGTKTGVDTRIGETVIFISPDTAGTTTTTTTTPKQP